MKVCIIGDGLVSLTLANVLIQKNFQLILYLIKILKNMINQELLVYLSQILIILIKK